jgi:hypothetical protein
MARTQKYVSLKAVVKEIDRTVKKLTALKRTTAAADRRILNLRIKSVRRLRTNVYSHCKALSVWPPRI